jgi:regulator of sigma E protease
MSNGWYLLAAIPVFGILILVHEFGHFLVAKWSDIRVEEFGIGFPPRLIGVKVGETVYSLNLIPLGGFVRMPGENGELTDELGRPDPRSFAAKPAWRRALVLIAGVAMNLVLAIILFMVAYGVGQPGIAPDITQVMPHSPAATAGLQKGDQIIAVDGHPVFFFTDVQNDVAQQLASAPPGVNSVPIILTLRRPGLAHPISIVVQAREHPPADQGAIGIVGGGKILYQHYPLWEAPWLGFTHTFAMLGMFFNVIGGMVTGVTHPQIAGPVGIVHITGETAAQVPTFGWWPILNLTAILSLNLAIINLIPFPALDGGRLALVGLEVVRHGRRLDPRREGLIHLVGMAVLISLIVIVSWNDIMNWLSQKPF